MRTLTLTIVFALALTGCVYLLMRASVQDSALMKMHECVDAHADKDGMKADPATRWNTYAPTCAGEVASRTR